MFTQLPSEIIDYILEYLGFKDVRSIACVCSAFRLSGQLRLFRTIYIRTDPDTGFPNHTQSILSSPHLLQYPSALIVQRYSCLHKAGISINSLWAYLPKMYRLSYVEIILEPRERLRALSALKRCGSAREIALKLGGTFTPDMLISDTPLPLPLPVHTLDLMVDAPGHQQAAQVIQKCSQSLRRLNLFLVNGISPTLPFLPRLSELSLYMEVCGAASDHNFTSWFPFLDRHPTITRLLLSTRFTLTVQPSPNLLPNLQFLKATPAIIERLVPGRPVNYIRVIYPSRLAYGLPFHANTMLRPLRRSIVPMTSLEINTDTFIPSDSLIDMVQALPKLRKFILEDPRYEVSVALQDLLAALGRCMDMVHIQLYLLASDVPPLDGKSLFSRLDFVQMVQRVQENGAADLWSFRIGINVRGMREICEAIRVGWLDVPSQPTLGGEWKFDIRVVYVGGYPRGY